MFKADLHMHSTASDGMFAPDELMRRAAGLGFTHVALTDHDSMEGLPLAKEAADALGMMLIPGVDALTRWAMLLYCTLPASYLAPTLGRSEEDYTMASGVCSILTVVSLAVFCVMAAVVA